MSLNSFNFQDLLQELMKRNRHNQTIIKGFHRVVQKRYNHFITSANQLPISRTANNSTSPLQFTPSRNHNKWHRQSLLGRLQSVKEGFDENKPCRYMEEKRSLKFGRQSIKNILISKKLLNQSILAKSQQPLKSLHFMNITFQEDSNKKAKKRLWKFVDKKNLHYYSYCPLFCLQKRENYSQDECI